MNRFVAGSIDGKVLLSSASCVVPVNFENAVLFPKRSYENVSFQFCEAFVPDRSSPRFSDSVKRIVPMSLYEQLSQTGERNCLHR
ncbi:MAG: hypothetical protein IPJ30_10385 [Acidobacteria bacterium]|nr:hypothetical protein [Acidobacteriota bacterium]